MTEPLEDPTDAAPFGLQLYEALRQAGLMSLVTSRLSYAQIQELKQADREALGAVFPGASYAMRQRFKTQSVEQILVLLLAERQRSEMALMTVLFAMG